MKMERGYPSGALPPEVAHRLQLTNIYCCTYYMYICCTVVPFEKFIFLVKNMTDTCTLINVNSEKCSNTWRY